MSLGFNRSNYVGYRQDFGVYRALVIDNNDPQIPLSGRVQVFIPEIHGMNLQQFLKGKSAVSYKFPGNNIISDLDANTLAYLREICPWASVAMPIVGESGPGLYEASSGNATVNDNPCLGTSDAAYPDKFIKPGAVHESAFNITTGSFANPKLTLTARGNSHDAEFRAPTYSNCPKGNFAIPRVGASLLVSFYKGDSNFPVVIGYLPSAQDFASVFTMDGSIPGYPGGFETPVNVQNQNPPVKPTPDAAQVQTQAALAQTSGTPISKLEPPVVSTAEINSQVSQINQRLAQESQTNTNAPGSVTTTKVATISQPVKKDQINPNTTITT